MRPRGPRRERGVEIHVEPPVESQALLGDLDHANVVVAFAGQRLDQARLFGGISERLPEMVHRLVEAPIEVDERAGSPEPVSQFFASDELAWLFQQREEQLKGLVTQMRSRPAWDNSPVRASTANVPKQ